MDGWSNPAEELHGSGKMYRTGRGKRFRTVELSTVNVVARKVEAVHQKSDARAMVPRTWFREGQAAEPVWSRIKVAKDLREWKGVWRSRGNVCELRATRLCGIFENLSRDGMPESWLKHDLVRDVELYAGNAQCEKVCRRDS